MTRSEFDKHVEDISTEQSNENWTSAAILRGIAREIGMVALDFNSDVSNHREFGEGNPNV